MKLISMVEFVLQQEKCLENMLIEKLPIIKLASSYDKIVNYANFLKQSLTLGMLVPCDESGNLLKEPKQTVFQDAHFDIDEMNNYHKAKEKVLFKGFKLIKRLDDYCGFESYRFEQNDEILNINFSHYTNVEKLIALQNIELTESVIKQIGLNP